MSSVGLRQRWECVFSRRLRSPGSAHSRWAPKQLGRGRSYRATSECYHSTKNHSIGIICTRRAIRGISVIAGVVLSWFKCSSPLNSLHLIGCVMMQNCSGATECRVDRYHSAIWFPDLMAHRSCQSPTHLVWMTIPAARATTDGVPRLEEVNETAIKNRVIHWTLRSPFDWGRFHALWNNLC